VLKQLSQKESDMTSHTGFEVFHKVAAEELNRCVADDEATAATALLRTIDQLHVPKHAHSRLLSILCSLWYTTGFQRWIYEDGAFDEEVQLVQRLIARFDGTPPEIREPGEQEAAE
jgi:hypothetical protein